MLQVNEFAAERGLMDAQIVEVVRERYPGYDKYLHSKVKSPDRYGVRLVAEAERLLDEAFLPTAPNGRKRDNRRLPVRIQCRLSKQDLGRLQQALMRSGFKTVQDGLAYIINQYLDKEGSHAK